MEQTQNQTRKWAWGKIFGYSALTLVLLATILYATVLKPYVVLGMAIGKTLDHKSGEISYESEGGVVTGKMELAGKNARNKFSMSLNEIEEIGGNLEVKMVSDQKNVFAQANFSNPKVVGQMLATYAPGINRTQTYKLVMPAITGKSWLHFNIPENVDEQKVDAEFDYNMSKDERAMLMRWVTAIKVNKIEKKHVFEGENYTKVSFGFNKERLIKAIESIKDTKADIRVSQINSMIEIVRSSDAWGGDLVKFLIDSKGELRIVMVAIPRIEEKVLMSGVEGGMDDQTRMMGGFASGFKNLIWKEEGEYVSLGIIRIGKFDQIEESPVPSPVVEAEALFAAAQKELLPIISQIMNQSAATQEMGKGMMPPKGKKK